MFFIGIFGISNKEYELKNLYHIYCKRCNENMEGKVIKTFNYFHVFFIPIFKWNEKYYFICNSCKKVYEIPKEKGKDMERGNDVNITYWDLNEYNNEYRDNINSNQRKCDYCGMPIDNAFEFCPYCGKKVGK